MNENYLYQLIGVCKTFQENDLPSQTVLNNVNLNFVKGETIAICGTSGSGKSTLLHILGTLDTPSIGKVLFLNKDIAKLSWEERTRVRNKEIGFVFQFHHLLSEFSVLENVMLPAIIGSITRSMAKERAVECLQKVGLKDKLSQRVTTLSGGERQRVSIARALCMQPKVILADEPTGNLDEKNGQQIVDLLLKLNEELSTTLVIVTHDMKLAHQMRRCLLLQLGEVYEV